MPVALRQLAGVRFEGGEFLQAVKPSSVENISVDNTSQQTTAVLDQCSVCISTNVDIHLNWGVNPTADTNSMMLNKGFYAFVFDTTDKLAVTKVAGQPDGIVSIIKPTELQR